MGVVAWVTDAGSPLMVRFPGDSTDSVVTLKADGLVLADQDRVLLVRAGSGWVVVCKVVAA